MSPQVRLESLTYKEKLVRARSVNEATPSLTLRALTNIVFFRYLLIAAGPRIWT